jgi:hypothetical protein
MAKTRWHLALACVVAVTQAASALAQVAPKAVDLVGTWQLISHKDLKTGTVYPNEETEWMQFTKSHWTVVSMEPGRKVTSNAEFQKLSPEAQAKVNYAKVWNEKNEQIFAARGGTYRVEGDQLHELLIMALQPQNVGVDFAGKIVQLDETTLVVQTVEPSPATNYQLTYRRLD